MFFLPPTPAPSNSLKTHQKFSISPCVFLRFSVFEADEAALRRVAELAVEERTGARALVTILEKARQKDTCSVVCRLSLLSSFFSLFCQCCFLFFCEMSWWQPKRQMPTVYWRVFILIHAFRCLQGDSQSKSECCTNLVQVLRNFKFELPSTSCTELRLTREMVDDPTRCLVDSSKLPLFHGSCWESQMMASS